MWNMLQLSCACSPWSAAAALAMWRATPTIHSSVAARPSSMAAAGATRIVSTARPPASIAVVMSDNWWLNENWWLLSTDDWWLMLIRTTASAIAIAIASAYIQFVVWLLLLDELLRRLTCRALLQIRSQSSSEPKSRLLLQPMKWQCCVSTS